MAKKNHLLYLTKKVLKEKTKGGVIRAFNEEKRF